MCICVTVSVCCIHVCVCVSDCFWPFSHSQWIVFFTTTVLCFRFHVNCSRPMCFSGEVAHERITLLLYQDTDYWKESVYILYYIKFGHYKLCCLCVKEKKKRPSRRAPTAYMLYCNSQRPKVVAESPGIGELTYMYFWGFFLVSEQCPCTRSSFSSLLALDNFWRS